MQNEQTLLDLGFTHHPEFDFQETGTKGFILPKFNKVFRAHVDDTQTPSSVSLGIIVNDKKNTVDRWRDCISDGSVQRKINEHG